MSTFLEIKQTKTIDMKKRKLNSKNPKYKIDTGEKLVVIKTVELTGKAKGRGIWYKKQ